MRAELLRLLQYYEAELGYLRRQGVEFAKSNSQQAAALQLDPTRSEDPHVERLLEGFAFLAARVHQKIDDELPEVTQSILESIYPEYVRPVPSMSIVQMQLDKDQGKLTSGYPVLKDTPLHTSVPKVARAGAAKARTPQAGAAAKVKCEFRTTFDTTLWPITVSEAGWVAPDSLDPPVRGTEAVAALRIMLRTQDDGSFSKLNIDSLRFYLRASFNIASSLYELLFNNCTRILLRKPGKSGGDVITLPLDSLHPVGFGEDEAVLPATRRSHSGFRLLTEYFTFPAKFFFFDLKGLERLRAAGFSDAVEMVFLISKFERPERKGLLEREINVDTIRLGCAPVINLFRDKSDSIQLNQRQQEYQLVADARRRDEVAIYSVESVTAVTGPHNAPIQFEPLYSYRHGRAGGGQHLWKSIRRRVPSRGDEYAEIFLSFVDKNARFVYPDLDSVNAEIICYNADHPSRMQIGKRDARGQRVDFEMVGGGPVRDIEALFPPTAVIEARTDSVLLWRLISLLSLNFVSLVDDGAATLQQMLQLHNPNVSDPRDREIAAIMNVSLSPAYARITGEHGLAFARGQRVELTLNEDEFAGGGAYLFATVLEHFLGVYTSLNSFSVLRVRSRQRRELLKDCVPRAGWKALV